MENPGIDPGASRMQIERSTTWANPPVLPLAACDVRMSFNSYVCGQIDNKLYKMENPGVDPGASRMQIERSTIWANPPRETTVCSVYFFGLYVQLENFVEQ